MAPPVPVRTPADAHWTCHGCGFCCRFHALGPVEPEIIDGLRELDVARHWPPAAEGWFDTRPTTAGPQHFLRKVDGACVFLEADNTCAVHARWGAQAKPGFCREYPWRVVEDPDGVTVTVREDCGGYHESTAADPSVAVQAAEAVDLPRLFQIPRWAPAQVPVAADQTVPLQAWMAQEPALLAAVAALDAGPVGLVTAVRDRLLPDAPAPQAGRADLAYRAALEALRMTMVHVVQHEQAPSAAEARFAKSMLDGVTLAQHAHADRPELDQATRAHANLLLRSLILSKQVHGDGTVVAGLGRWLLVARAAGALAGRRTGGPVGVGAWAAEFTRLSRFAANRSMDRVLQAARPALVDMVMHG